MPSFESPSLLRRVAVMIYESLVLSAVLLVAFVPVSLVAGGEVPAQFKPLLTLYALLVSFVYFAWQWVRLGQTLAMKTWKVKVVRTDGGPLSWRDAALRFGAALVSWVPFGLGYWWVALDDENLAWHDRWSGTRLVIVEYRG